MGALPTHVPRGTPLTSSALPAGDPRALLAAGLAELRIEPSPPLVDRLHALAELVAQWGERINLTGHRTVAAIAQRLVLDAVALDVALGPVPSLVDLGSGSGFPGLPIAIHRPACRVLLVDARERRYHFERAAIRALGLENVRAQRGRAELLSPEPQSAVVAQALARPGAAVSLMLRWATPGGLLVIPGAEAPPHIEHSEAIPYSEVREYRVPLGGPLRTLWIGHAAP